MEKGETAIAAPSTLELISGKTRKQTAGWWILEADTKTLSSELKNLLLM